MARAILVKKARKDYPEHGIKKGEPYYWWKFRFGSKQFSKTPPRPSQLTQSSFLSSMYDLNDRISGISVAMSIEDIQAEVEDIVSEIDNLKDECESNLDNIPEQLQEGNAGTLLQERIDELDSMSSDLGGIDCDIDETLSEKAKKEKIEEIVDEIHQYEYSGG